MWHFRNTNFYTPTPLRIIFAIVIGVIIAIALLMGLVYLGLFLSASIPFEWYTYQTTDLADYGEYIGNNNNKAPQEFITSFFPSEIQDGFSDITYSYRAEKRDSYGYEAYLEFTIEDSDAYQSYISQIGNPESWRPFAWDDCYQEYTIAHKMSLHPRNEDGSYTIKQAEIGKILRCDETQSIIFVAIGVYDGGGVTTDYLCVFFNRFDIDPYAFSYQRGQENSLREPLGGKGTNLLFLR